MNAKSQFPVAQDRHARGTGSTTAKTPAYWIGSMSVSVGVVDLA